MRTAEILRLLLSLSCSGTLLAGAVWLCRRLFGRWLSCTAKYYLWLLVLLRLVLPLGLPGSVMETAADRLNALATGYRAEQSLQGDEELYAPVPGTGQTAGGTAAEAPITAPTDGMPAGDAAQPTLPDTPTRRHGRDIKHPRSSCFGCCLRSGRQGQDSSLRGMRWPTAGCAPP